MSSVLTELHEQVLVVAERPFEVFNMQHHDILLLLYLSGLLLLRCSLLLCLTFCRLLWFLLRRLLCSLGVIGPAAGGPQQQAQQSNGQQCVRPHVSVFSRYLRSHLQIHTEQVIYLPFLYVSTIKSVCQNFTGLPS